MLRIFIPAPPDLEDYISHYLYLDFRTGRSGQQILCSSYPDAYCVMTIFFSADLPKYTIGTGTFVPRVGFISGLLARGAYIEDSRAHYQCIIIFLKPCASRILFNIPGSDIFNSFIDISDVPVLVKRLPLDALYSMASIQQRIECLNTFFSQQLRLSYRDSLILPLLTKDLLNSKGVIRVDELMHRYRISVRQIDRLFQLSYGVTPKQFARLARLGAAYRMLLSGYDIHDVIYLLKYYDQAHLNHDFSQYSHITPCDLIKSSNKILFPKILNNIK